MYGDVEVRGPPGVFVKAIPHVDRTLQEEPLKAWGQERARRELGIRVV